MAKYLLLKHYRGAPASVNDVPMDRWAPDEVEAHIQFMRDFADRLDGHRRVRGRAGPRPRRASGSAPTAGAGPRSSTAPSPRRRTSSPAGW